MSDKKLDPKKCAEKLQALAEENRIRIIECLLSGPKNVTELANLLEEPIVNVSHHLGVLKGRELVQAEKHGRYVRYSLNPQYFHNNGDDSGHLDLGWCQITIPHEPAATEPAAATV